jgi:AhpD family alkylhydroperoxidase
LEQRLNYAKAALDAYKAMLGLEQYLQQCGLEQSLLHLVKLRASQINGCAFCLDMHWKDLRAIGEAEQRLYSLDGMEGMPILLRARTRALTWTEAVTLITNGHVPDGVYEHSVRTSAKRNCLTSPSRWPPSIREIVCPLPDAPHGERLG